MTVAFRVEIGDKIIWQDDTGKKLVMPSEAVCRERLTTMLEKFTDPNHPMIKKFWNERALALSSASAVEAEYNTELFVLLDKVWEELTKPKEEINVFASYGDY